MSDLLSLFLEKRRITTDTRKLESGDMYFALKGANFDGNAFADKALEAGASCVVIDDITVHKPLDDRYFYAFDVLETLQELALSYRRTLDIPIIGLGGSNGKTTTKELLLAAFQGNRKVHATAGNYNNHIGVPLTLLSIPADAELAIIEMGTNQPGDMELLCALAEPDFGLLTNIGKEHLELLHDLDGVQREEGTLFQYLNEREGTVFVNMADDRVAAEGAKLEEAICYGNPGSEAYAEVLDMRLDGMRLAMRGPLFGEDFEIEAKLSGHYNAANVVAAAAVAAYFGVPTATIASGIGAYESSNNRSELVQRGAHTIWLDAYNANPSSMEAAIAHVCSMPNTKVALILGDMRELGETSQTEHAALGTFIQDFDVAMTIGIGQEMKAMIEQAPEPKHWFATVAEARESVWDLIAATDTVLIKASRGMKLEGLLHP
ncbi:MAG: UDP-N-acetylmuramoyl-tripeptide--D-alanyl-D-alanine ligase [Bacteroidia bacterium]